MRDSTLYLSDYIRRVIKSHLPYNVAGAPFFVFRNALGFTASAGNREASDYLVIDSHKLQPLRNCAISLVCLKKTTRN